MQSLVCVGKVLRKTYPSTPCWAYDRGSFPSTFWAALLQSARWQNITPGIFTSAALL